MRISRYNPEGYPDPTPHEALTRIIREEEKSTFGYRPIVYICSPYRGDTETNTRNAERYCRLAVEKGCIPFAPHLLYPHFMKEETERPLALFMGLLMLDKCKEVWVFGDVITDGMKSELERAQRRMKTIKYFDGNENKNE